jgi:hypothetical protein
MLGTQTIPESQLTHQSHQTKHVHHFAFASVFNPCPLRTNSSRLTHSIESPERKERDEHAHVQGNRTSICAGSIYDSHSVGVAIISQLNPLGDIYHSLLALSKIYLLSHICFVSQIRCVVLSGAGSLFTAGLDLAEASSSFLATNPNEDPARVGLRTWQFVTAWQSAFTNIEKCLQVSI